MSHYTNNTISYQILRSTEKAEGEEPLSPSALSNTIPLHEQLPCPEKEIIGVKVRKGHILKRERELRGWSQARLAEEIGTTSLNISRWERGASVPYPYFREKLCVLFRKDACQLGWINELGKEE